MDETVDYRLSTGKVVRLEYDESDVTVLCPNGKKIGRLGLRFREGEPSLNEPDYIEFYDAEIDNDWRREGIARRAVQFALEATTAACVLAPHHTDTMKLNGNMLTTDGAALVERLREEGLIAPHVNDKASEDQY